MLTHRGDFLVTGLHRQLLIEWLRITKHNSKMQIYTNLFEMLINGALSNLFWEWAHYPCRHHKCYTCLFTRQNEKKLIDKVSSSVFQKKLSECICTYTLQWRKMKSPEFALIQSTQYIVFAIFRDHMTISISWKKKKATSPVVQTQMIIQGPELPY